MDGSGPCQVGLPELRVGGGVAKAVMDRLRMNCGQKSNPTPRGKH